MFELIAYIFKVIIAMGIGYVLSYSSSKDDKQNILTHYSSLSCFFTTSLIGVIILVENFNIILIGIVFLAINYYLIKVIDKFTLEEKYKILFASINGLIIGLGYIFYSIIITLIFIYIVNNFDIIYQLINNDKIFSSKNKDTTSQSDDIKNNLELSEEDS